MFDFCVQTTSWTTIYQHMRQGIVVSSFNILNKHETFVAVTAAEWRSLQLVFLSTQRELPSPPVCCSLRQSKVA